MRSHLGKTLATAKSITEENTLQNMRKLIKPLVLNVYKLRSEDA